MAKALSAVLIMIVSFWLLLCALGSDHFLPVSGRPVHETGTRLYVQWPRVWPLFQVQIRFVTYWQTSRLASERAPGDGASLAWPLAANSAVPARTAIISVFTASSPWDAKRARPARLPDARPS